NAEARRAAAPVLHEVLHQAAPDQRVRAEIIVYLWKIGPEPDSTFPTLASGDSGDVHAAAMLLLKLADKEAERNAVPTLIAAIKGGDASHRVEFIRVLAQLGPEGKDALPVLR